MMRLLIREALRARRPERTASVPLYSTHVTPAKIAQLRENVAQMLDLVPKERSITEPTRRITRRKTSQR